MFKGWEKVVGETTQLDLTGNENNQLSSVRVRPGCTLHLFKNSNNDGSKESVTSDVRYYAFPGINHGLNDQVSSLSCTCTAPEGDDTDDVESLEDTTTHITTTPEGKILSM